MLSSSSFLRGLVLLGSFSLVSATWSNNFAGFFPNYNAGFQLLLRDNCSSQYAIYLENRDDDPRIDPSLAAFHMNSVESNVIECLLDVAPEFVKAKLASAQVVLGLTPSILATLGASPQETAMLSVIAKRPLLAGLLAAGSPAVFAHRSFDYIRAIEDLKARNFQTPPIFTGLDGVIVIVEYLAALVSMANIGELCYRLGAHVITATFTGGEYHYFLWAFLGMTVHGFGALTLRRRTKVTTAGDDDDGCPIFRHYVHAMINQFKPMAPQYWIHVEIREESLLFFAVYWFTNVLTVCHIVYGTILFSSMLFISINDALTVIVRLMASVMICRLVLSYELVNLRRVVKGIENETAAKDTDATTEGGMAERQPSK